MKYTTFRNTILAGTVLAVGGGFFYFIQAKPVKNAPIESANTQDPPASALPPTAEAKPLVPVSAGQSADQEAPVPPATRGLVALPKASAPEADGKAEHRAKTPLREVDRELLQLVKQPLTGKAAKGKDVFPSRPYKVNLYLEGTSVVRAKVDLNRNGKWDEKWSFEPGDAPVVKRQVSPADDDTNYPLTYKLAGDSWVPKTQ